MRPANQVPQQGIFKNAARLILFSRPTRAAKTRLTAAGPDARRAV